MSFHYQIDVGKHFVTPRLLKYLRRELPESEIDYEEGSLKFTYKHEPYLQEIIDTVGATREVFYFKETLRLREQVTKYRTTLHHVWINGHLSELEDWIDDTAYYQRLKESMKMAEEDLNIDHKKLGECPHCDGVSIYLFDDELYCALCGAAEKHDELHFCPSGCGEFVTLKGFLCHKCEEGEIDE